MTRALHLGLPALALAVAMGCGPAGTAAVAPTPPSPPPAPPAPIVLSAGEVVELELSDGSEAAATLATPRGDERFLVVLASARSSGRESKHTYEIEPTPRPSSPWRRLKGCSVNPREVQSARELAASNSTVSPPAVGDRRELFVRNGSAPETVTAQVVAVRDNTVVWAEVDESNELRDDFVRAFVDDFEALILPRARAVFGRESDVDGDGRIALFFTPRTKDAAVAYFSGCDLGTPEDCPGSNHAELLYLTPPHAIRPPYNTPRAIKEILAHELEHLIHQNQKVLRTDLPADPDAMYLLEGFGALAQDVTGHQSGNLYVTKAGLEGIDELSAVALLQEGLGYEEQRDGALRGGAYLFVRWLYDRAGGDAVSADGTISDRGGPTLVRQLLGAPRAISSALPDVVGARREDVVVDFYTAVALSGRDAIGDVPPRNDCFRFAPPHPDPITGKPRGTDLFAQFHGQRMAGPAVQPITAPDGSLRTGGVEVLSFEAVDTTSAGFTLRVDVDADARIRIARVR